MALKILPIITGAARRAGGAKPAATGICAPSSPPPTPSSPRRSRASSAWRTSSPPSPRKPTGRFTGRVSGTPCFREGKITRVEQWLRRAGQGAGAIFPQAGSTAIRTTICRCSNASRTRSRSGPILRSSRRRSRAAGMSLRSTRPAPGPRGASAAAAPARICGMMRPAAALRPELPGGDDPEAFYHASPNLAGRLRH